MTPADRPTVGEVLHDLCEQRRLLYVQTRNGVHALTAYHLARHFRVPIPEWVLAYFDRAITAILDDTAPPAQAFALVPGQGAKHALSRATREERDLAIVAFVLHAREAERPPSDECIFADLADQFGLSPERVRNIFYTRTVPRPTPA